MILAPYMYQEKTKNLNKWYTLPKLILEMNLSRALLF